MSKETMDEKEKHILKEASKIFRKLGIRSISMDDIARELVVSKKTLYQYFENKADLLDKMFDQDFEESNCAMITIFNESKNAIDVLLDISKSVSDKLKNIKPSFAFELQKYYPAIYHKYMEKNREVIFDGIRKNIEKGMGEGLYREDLDIDLVARLYIQKLEDVHNYEFLSSLQFSFQKIFLVMFENHIRGIANKQGLEYFEKEKERMKELLDQ